MSAASSNIHSTRSSHREALLEHLFAGEVMRHLWLRAFVTGSTQLMSNAVYANEGAGIEVFAPFSGVITKNNMFGNGTSGCGLVNFHSVNLVATNNSCGIHSART